MIINKIIYEFILFIKRYKYYQFLLDFSSTNNTVPKAPAPSTFKIMKSSKVTFFPFSPAQIVEVYLFLSLFSLFLPSI